jgi:selenide,water dikinase
VLRPLSDNFNAADFPALLVGLQAPDDAAVYRVNEGQAIVSTVDFFPPVVDDPYAFGQIAAANAMSDIYAMGGEVLFAINLAAFPANLELSILADILRGGAERVRAAGAVIAGGHTITDKEPKYGLAVTGIVDPARLITKSGAQPGDVLVLTKPLGVGVITTALKREVADKDDVAAAMQSMIQINRGASRAAQAVGVHAMTDITGYSLLGHAHEMAHLSGVDLEFSFAALPWLPGAARYAREMIFPGGASNNFEYFTPWVQFDESFDEATRLLMFDPETSGGLLIALAEERLPALQAALAAQDAHGWVIGAAASGDGHLRVKR